MTDNTRERPRHDDAVIDALDRATGVTLTGMLLNAASRGERWQPIRQCLCAQDSPEHPCLCTGPLVWIPRSAILRQEATSRHDQHGRGLTALLIERDAKVVIEQLTTERAEVSASRVAQRARQGQPGFRGTGTAPGDAPPVARGAAKWVGEVVVGYLAGKAIDWLVEAVQADVRPGQAGYDMGRHEDAQEDLDAGGRIPQ